MFSEAAHSCVRTLDYLLDKYERSQAHIAREDGTGARPKRNGVPVTTEIAIRVRKLARCGRHPAQAARDANIHRETARRIINGTHPICRTLEAGQ